MKYVQIVASEILVGLYRSNRKVRFALYRCHSWRWRWRGSTRAPVDPFDVEALSELADDMRDLTANTVPTTIPATRATRMTRARRLPPLLLFAIQSPKAAWLTLAR